MAVDYGFHAILTGNLSFEVIEEIGDVDPRRHPDDQDADDLRLHVATTATATGVMSEVAEHGGMSVVHAEDDAIANWLTKKYVREGKTHGAYICETRGPLVEEAAIRRAHAARGALGLAAVRPPHGRRSAAIGAGRGAREGPAVLRRDAASPTSAFSDIWDERRADGRRHARAALQQLPGAEVPGRPGRLLGGDRRRPAPGRRHRPLRYVRRRTATR